MSSSVVSFRFAPRRFASPRSLLDRLQNWKSKTVGISLQTKRQRHSDILRDKMICTVRFGNSFLRVPLMYQPCCLVPYCQGKIGDLTKKPVYKTYSTVHFVS